MLKTRLLNQKLPLNDMGTANLFGHRKVQHFSFKIFNNCRDVFVALHIEYVTIALRLFRHAEKDLRSEVSRKKMTGNKCQDI